MAKIETNEKGEQVYRYSEIFQSFQGEGTYTGRSTAWIRFFLCNLTCDGFGQKDPTDPSTYVLPYKDIDLSSITRVEDLPVFEFGCDSSYTWSKRFKHLMHKETASEICDKIQNTLKHPTNPEGLFRHPITDQWHHMAFTGGEPMLNQDAMCAILEEFERRDNLPKFVTVETNGTQKLADNLFDIIAKWYNEDNGGEWFWSVSPKLFSTSGEKPKKAIKPFVVADYALVSNHGHLKYVVNGTPQSWEEVEEHSAAFTDAGCLWEIYIMPVGATKEEQEDEQIAKTAVEAMLRGYHFSGRLHCYVFGNKIGT